MTVTVRISEPRSKAVTKQAVSPRKPTRIKVVKGSQVVIVDEATGEVIDLIDVKRVDDAVEMTVVHKGEQHIVVLQDADGLGISVRDEVGRFVGSDPAIASAQSSVSKGIFLVGDAADAAGLGWGTVALAGLGGLALALSGGSSSDNTDRIPPVVGALDITNATDTGANDLLTGNGLPQLIFTGEAGLTIRLFGANGAALAANQYSVTYANGTYTVSLLDANPAVAGPQAFGSFSGGAASGNPASSVDGRYTIVAYDAAGNASTVGVFTIDTTPAVITVPLDITAATDSGADDSFTNNGLPVLTFEGEAGLTISVDGVGGVPLDASQYEVQYLNGVYTVRLLDAVVGGAVQEFGSFLNGVATGNPAESLDGTYTIVATDHAANRSNVGTFVIDTTVPALTPPPLDIVAFTDTGANDLVTANGLPVLTFAGEAGLSITLQGTDGLDLDPRQYEVNYANGTYSVALLDANLSLAGPQSYGTNLNGVPTGNPAASGDGFYRIVARDAADNFLEVGRFEIDTTVLAPADLDISAGTDTGNDDLLTGNGLPVLTFRAESGLTVA